MRCGVRGRGATAAQAACVGMARLKAMGGQGTRGAHGEHVTLVRDAGHVEVERLVERRRVLPSRKEGIRCGAKCGPADGRDGQGTRGAHVEHVVHVCDAGRVEAQRLVERHRALPSRKGSIGRGVTCGAGRREGVEKRLRRK